MPQDRHTEEQSCRDAMRQTGARQHCLGVRQCLVPPVRLERTLSCENQILSLACLPIPPQGHCIGGMPQGQPRRSV